MLIDLVRELNSLNDDNLAARVIANSDVQWCLGELQDMLEAGISMEQWTSMGERPPGDNLIGNTVIVSIRPRYGEPYTTTMIWWGDRHQYIWQDVTRWMPMPEPPEED